MKGLTKKSTETRANSVAGRFIKLEQNMVKEQMVLGKVQLSYQLITVLCQFGIGSGFFNSVN
jgi:hypothetical protein